MKVSIRTEVANPHEPVMKLELAENSKGEVSLVGYDGNDTCWLIAEISGNGITLYANIGNTSGWPLDELGRVRMVK